MPMRQYIDSQKGANGFLNVKNKEIRLIHPNSTSSSFTWQIKRISDFIDVFYIA